MTYKELLIKLAKSNEFDYVYTLKHLAVDEVFRSELAIGKEWYDKADQNSITEL